MEEAGFSDIELLNLSRFHRHHCTIQVAIAHTKAHLDYGCGTGDHTDTFKIGLREAYVVGYDIDSERVASARERFTRRGTIFVDSIADATVPFETMTSLFVLHETDDRLAVMQMRELLARGGTLCIMDYDMVGMTMDRFEELFIGKYEIEEMEAMGFEQAYEAHTRKGLEHCIELAESLGFKTTDTARDEKFYLWVGKAR